MKALDREGKLDPVTSARLIEQAQQEYDRVNRESNGKVTPESLGYGLPLHQRPLSLWLRIPLGSAFIFVIGGFLLELTIGSGFIFAFSSQYKTVMPWLGLAAALPVGVALLYLEKKDRFMSNRYPTWVIRWLIVFPLMTATVSAGIVISPFGWAAIAGWLFGTPSDHIQAKVIFLRAPSKRLRWLDCRQEAMLEAGAGSADICLDNRVLGPMPGAGDAVAVAGRTSVLGVYVQTLKRK